MGAPMVPPPVFERVLETVAAVENVDTIIATQALFYVLGRRRPGGAADDFVQTLVRCRGRVQGEVSGSRW